jgi:hypothetical protein
VTWDELVTSVLPPSILTDGGYAPAGSMLMKEDGELDSQRARWLM